MSFFKKVSVQRAILMAILFVVLCVVGYLVCRLAGSEVMLRHVSASPVMI